MAAVDGRKSGSVVGERRDIVVKPSEREDRRDLCTRMGGAPDSY
jgi:hypothetical protein